MITFKPKVNGSRVAALASHYSFADDQGVEAIGSRTKDRGYLTRDDFLTICRWKTRRSQSRCAANSESLIREATRFALSTPEEALRIGTLTLLRGVEYPTASVILHLCHKDRYPILDFRALESLSCDVPAVYGFDFWWEYTQFCRQLADRWHVGMRELDRALWQYSKERA